VAAGRSNEMLNIVTSTVASPKSSTKRKGKKSSKKKGNKSKKEAGFTANEILLM